MLGARKESPLYVAKQLANHYGRVLGKPSILRGHRFVFFFVEIIFVFGAMDVSKPYKSIGFGAMYVTKPYKFSGLVAMEVTKPYKVIGLSGPQARFSEEKGLPKRQHEWVYHISVNPSTIVRQTPVRPKRYPRVKRWISQDVRICTLPMPYTFL